MWSEYSTGIAGFTRPILEAIVLKLTTVIRIFLGLFLVVFGLNGFLGFLPQPELPAEAGAFFGAMLDTGYLIPFVKGVEVLVGIALLSNRWVALALTVLAPVVLNIVAFHLFLAPAGLPPGILLLILSLFLAWQYRAAYRGLLVSTAGIPAAEEAPERVLATA